MKDAGKNSEPLDAILRRAMRQRPDAPTPECADVESLAAYWDKSLGAAERERLEAHFADCTRCQMQLAAFARADESARSMKPASEVPWYRRWRLAIPAIAAVAAIVMFVAMRRPATEESNRDQLVAMAKREAPAVELAQPAPAPAAQVAAPASPPAAAPSLLAMNGARSESTEEREAPAIELAAKPPALAPAVPVRAPTGPAPIVASPASSEITMNEAKTAAPPRAEAMNGAIAQRMTDSAAAPGARAMTAPAAVPGMRAMVAGGGAAVAQSVGGAISQNYAAASGAAMPATISPPDRSVTWIIGKNGMVQRRDADGATQIQHSGVSTDLLAGAAPSATVCWIVGRSGTIIRTTDGEHWALIKSPTADNLAAVSASSTNDATITTAGGQRYRTSDGGSSWHSQ